MRILLFDIETRPNLAYVWGRWQQNISPNMVLDTVSILCVAYSWLDQKKVTFDRDPKTMLKGIHAAFNEADVVVTWNGKSFDEKHLNREFLLAGMPPPKPSTHIDLMRVCKQRFKFESNKLDEILKELGFEGKVKHSGFALWKGCMNGDAKSWRLMERYNKRDVAAMKPVYERFLPWIKTCFPPHNSIDGTVNKCRCGAPFERLIQRGFRYTQSGRFQRYSCLDCGTWLSSRQRQDTHVAVQ